MIPKIIHQIWIGDEPPKFISDAMETVKSFHPDYTYILHDNSALEKYNITIGTKHSFSANILRVKVLSEFGGWYIDADTIALSSINELNINEFTTQALDGSTYQHNNGIFACKKGTDFNSFLDEYTPTNICVPLWDKYCKENDVNKFDIDKVGINGKILKDLRMSSWSKEI